jgi:hypothetical protein
LCGFSNVALGFEEKEQEVEGGEKRREMRSVVVAYHTRLH